MSTIVLTSERPAFEFTVNGTATRWEYDVIDLKLAYEALESKHGIRSDDGLKAPTQEFLSDAAAMLLAKGLTIANADLAFRIHAVVNTQFVQLTQSIAQQAVEL